jgi:zinc transporter ZupT
MSVGDRNTQAQERLPRLVEHAVALARCFLSAVQWQNLPFPNLFNACPAALYQNNQHDHKQHSGDDSNQGCIIHLFLSLSLDLLQPLSEALRHDDKRRADHDHKQGREDKKHQRKYQLYRCLSCLFLHVLATLSAQRVRVNA